LQQNAIRHDLGQKETTKSHVLKHSLAVNMDKFTEQAIYRFIVFS